MTLLNKPTNLQSHCCLVPSTGFKTNKSPTMKQHSEVRHFAQPHLISEEQKITQLILSAISLRVRKVVLY